MDTHENRGDQIGLSCYLDLYHAADHLCRVFGGMIENAILFPTTSMKGYLMGDLVHFFFSHLGTGMKLCIPIPDA